jgi:hypothetical protein
MAMIFRMPKESVILVQFPAYGFASKILLQVILRRLKCVVLVHDLERLRGKSAGSSESELQLASFIIYTGRLQTQLANLDVPSATLEAWDYRLDQTYQAPVWDPTGVILFAGNLSQKKNGWLYHKSVARPPLRLYGNRYRKDLNPNEGDDYRGEFAPDEPSFQGPISWGLVWEGSSTRRNSNDNEREYYERFNQPHKLSLYLACCLPVIAWRKAAIAGFIEEYKCGILIDDLEEIDAQIAKHSRTELLCFRENAIKLSAKMKSGFFIRKAVSQIISDLTSCQNV